MTHREPAYSNPSKATGRAQRKEASSQLTRQLLCQLAFYVDVYCKRWGRKRCYREEYQETTGSSF